MSEENENEIEHENVDVSSEDGQRLIEEIFQYPVYHPTQVHPNIVRHPQGEWMFVMCYGLPNDEGYINIAIPIEVAKLVAPDMLKQIEQFEANGGQKQNAN